MRRSILNLNVPPPPGHLTIFCAWGVGNLTRKAFPGVGNLTFARGSGKNEPEVSGLQCILFCPAPNARVCTDGAIQGQRASCSQKKDFERSVLFLKVCMNTRVCSILRLKDEATSYERAEGLSTSIKKPNETI